MTNSVPVSSTSSGWKDGRRSRKFAESLARAIVDEIVTKQLQPGSTLPLEAEMIRSYGVARNTLREALRILEVEGLIHFKPGRGGGPVIQQLTPGNLGDMAKLHLFVAGANYSELLEARLVIEPALAAMAAEKALPKSRERLRLLMDAADETDLDDDAEYSTMVRDFHSFVAEIAENRALDLVGQALKKIHDSRTATAVMDRRERPAVVKVHREIGEAILESRAVDAETLMRDHIVKYAKRAQRKYPTLATERIVWD